MTMSLDRNGVWLWYYNNKSANIWRIHSFLVRGVRYRLYKD